MEKKNEKEKNIGLIPMLLVRITYTHPVIAFHSYSISEYGSSIKLTNCLTLQILTPCTGVK